MTNIFFHIVQIGGDRFHREDHIAVVGHDTFGIARAARGVDQAGEIAIDDLALRAMVRVAGQQILVSPDPRRGWLGLGCLGQDPRPQRRQTAQKPAQKLEVHSSGHQGCGLAIARDVVHLVVLGRWIQDDEDCAGFQDGEDADHKLDGVGQVEDNTVPSAHALVDQRLSQAISGVIEVLVGQAAIVAHQCYLGGQALSTLFQELVHQAWSGSHVGISCGSSDQPDACLRRINSARFLTESKLEGVISRSDVWMP